MPGPEESAIVDEERAEVRRALERLPVGYRTVLHLRHVHVLSEREIAAILGLPLGTVQWRCKRAHDHLHQVLTLRSPRPLAATVREVLRTMETRVSTEKPAEPVTPSGRIVWQPADWASASAASPAFPIPEALRLRFGHVTMNLGQRPSDAPKDPGHLQMIQFLTRLGSEDVVIHFWPPDVAPKGPAMTHIFPGAQIGVDQDTQVGGRPAHWTQVNGQHHLFWLSATGGYWSVASRLPPEEVRGIGEAIEAEARLAST